jgi:hypothetical protein
VARLGFEEKPIYRLEPGDDIQELVSALQKADDPLAIFMDHAEASVLKNVVNLKLLQKYAKEARRQLVLITKDPIVQSLAEEQGIEWYPSEYELADALGVLAQVKDTAGTGDSFQEKGGRDTVKGGNGEPIAHVGVRRPGLQQWIVLVIAAIAVGMLYYALMPKVTVVVTPELLIYQQSVQMVGVGPETTDVETGGLPVLPLTSVKAVIETEAIVSATGSQILGTAFAKGVVVFINEGDEPVSVPKGTLLKTGEGVVFQTDEAVIIPGRSTEYFLDVAAGVRAGQKEVGITASEAGEKGNVAAGRIRVFADSALGKRLVVRNPEPVRGGMSINQTKVTDQDISRALEVCSRQANLKAREILQAKADQEGSVLIPESVVVTEDSVEPEVNVGDEAQTVKVLARFHAQAQSFRRQDVGEVLERELGMQLPEELVIYQPRFEIQQLTAVLQKDCVMLDADVRAPVHRKFLPSDLARLLVGLGRQEVEQLAKALDVDSVVVTPKDVERLPRFAHWIKVEVKGPEAEVVSTEP